MKILIGGEDDIAFRLAEALMADHEVSLVCPEEAKNSKADRLDVELIYGDVTTAESLQRANVARAELFIACSPEDERNLVACVTAKRLGARRTTCFLFRRGARTSEKDISALGASLGIDSLVLPAQRLAREILRIVAVPGALEVEAFEGGRVRLVRRAVEDGAFITSGPLKDIGVPKGVVLVMARRGEETFIPSGRTHFLAGDQITAMGTLAGINRLLHRYLKTGASSRQSRRATVVGAGVVGYSVAKGLEEAGWEVKVIDSDRKRCEEVAAQLKCMVLHGDGTDLDLLEEEHIAETSVLVAVTSNDEKNLLISLIAKQHLGVPRIVTRADNPVNERLFEKVGIDVVRSARGAAINSVVRNVAAAHTDLIAELEHGDVVVLRLEVPAHREPKPLSEMHAPVFAIVGSILRDGQVIIPQGDDEIRGGDRLLVFCSREDEDNARRFFQRFEL
ncbi:MAG: Trk system potassium transporter TrkA [Planctomycetes bacterium]|nr:Trk system potassium transporter TrkA [Planctomycetota bacterium]MBL7008314.1 Trk system potassium transporter TrkA [Planctomycetota bacterium]